MIFLHLSPDLRLAFAELQRRRAFALESVYETLALYRELPEETLGRSIADWHDASAPVVGEWLAACGAAEMIRELERVTRSVLGDEITERTSG